MDNGRKGIEAWHNEKRKHYKFWESTAYFLFEISASIILSFISLRVLIFSPGFYDYSDVHWGIIATPHLLGTFSPFQTPAGFVLYGFMRDVVSWPYYLMYIYRVPMAIIERALLLYSFILYFMIAFRLSDYIIRSLSRRNDFLLGKKAQFGTSMITAIFAFSNLGAMNYNVDGGTFNDGLILLFMACTLAIIIFEKNRKKQFTAISFLLIISTLLDPDYYIYFIIVIFFALVVNGAISHKFIKSIVTALSIVSVSLMVPTFIFIAGIYSTPITTPVTGLGVYRVLPTSISQFSISSPYFLYFLLLFGHGWSMMTYGPITILEYYGHILDAPSLFSPAQILIPPGPITLIWFFSLFMIPFFAFATLISRNTRKLIIPVALTTIFILMLSQYQYISPLLFIFDKMGSMHFIGSAFSTTFGRPAHALIVISASYIVMLCVFLVELQNKAEVLKQSKEGSGKLLKFYIGRLRIKISISQKTKGYIIRATVILLIFVIIFSGWQAFNGDFYPSRAFPPNNGGNQVVEEAPYQPYPVPQSAFMVLNYLQEKETNPVQILQIVAPYVSNKTFLGFEGNINPHLRLNGNDLVGDYVNELIAENLTSDIAPFLRANSIGYVVVEFYSIAPAYVDQQFGFSNFGIVLQRLDESPGLLHILSYPNISLYKVAGVNNLYYDSQLSLYIPNIGNFTPEIYHAFNIAGFNVSLTSLQNYGASFNLNPNIATDCNTSISLFSTTELYRILNNSKAGESFSLAKSPGFPFQHVLNIKEGMVTLAKENISCYYYIYMNGVGKINGVTVNTSSLWRLVSVRASNSLSLGGNFSISFIIQSKGGPLSSFSRTNIVYNVGAARGYELISGNVKIPGGIPTFQGTNLFINVPSNGSFHIVASFVAYIYAYYIVIVVISALLGFYSIGLLDRKKWIKLIVSS